MRELQEQEKAAFWQKPNNNVSLYLEYVGGVYCAATTMSGVYCAATTMSGVYCAAASYGESVYCCRSSYGVASIVLAEKQLWEWRPIDRCNNRVASGIAAATMVASVVSCSN
ncbi:hypothetical protein AVEN_11586-1 [Araneus ventricosus]|uniref:Uncharacterized protein n=1 Tax=Araneus ventricosus TaxID=182803 RepID=A0A4Y2V5F2_ARAVE|nr:hypothetical protein AVEN_11586-1 [Araneus ventricosus]